MSDRTTGSEGLFLVNEFGVSADRMPALLNHFQADQECLERLLIAPCSPKKVDRLRRFFHEWRLLLKDLPFAEFSPGDRADWLLLRTYLDAQERRLERDASIFNEVTASLFPFATELIALDESRRAFESVVPRTAAKVLDETHTRLKERRTALESGTEAVNATLAVQAAKLCTQLRKMLEDWHGFYHGYDPVFDWWMVTPYKALDSALEEYAKFLRETVGGMVGDAISGEPLGRDALISELRGSQVPYEPEEMIAAAREEWDWCLAEMRRAAAEMGCGDDWKVALERVKADHAEPGEQPALVCDLAYEAIAYVEKHDLVTVPPLAREGWRMSMMSAERQKTSPFFLGGEQIIVSFPTSEMTQTQKEMSLRGNNRACSRATVQHELIPGHHLQMYSMERYRPYRRLFWTPFWIEGWTLHWEMLLWEREFARTPEERVGMLFWRLHRAARVIFSLEFHMGQRTAAECVELLVNEAGHERDNALAEVRRSFEGDYGPLYQCAYLIGGWQMHALYRELVGGGRMTNREFHDAVMRENCIPIPTLRALLTRETLTRDFDPNWRFHPLPAPDGNYGT